MAKVIPVGPIDPVLYGFAKKQAEKAERDPRYVPKRLETPAHSITYRRVGATVKAFVVDKIAPVWTGKDQTYAVPVVQNIPYEDMPYETPEYKPSNAAIFANPSFKGIHGFSGYASKQALYLASTNEANSSFLDFAYFINRRFVSVIDNSVDVNFYYDEAESDWIRSGIGVNNSSQPYTYDTNNKLAVSFSESWMENEIEIDANNVYPFAIVDGILPTIRRSARSSGTLVCTYNYIQSFEVKKQQSIFYARFNTSNFSAKTKDDISPPEYFEIAPKSNEYHYEFNPNDTWYPYSFYYPRKYSLESNYPSSTSSTLTARSVNGELTHLSTVAVDCIGEFYHAEISASTGNMVSAPPWEIKNAVIGTGSYAADKYLQGVAPALPSTRKITLYKNGTSIAEVNVNDLNDPMEMQPVELLREDYYNYYIGYNKTYTPGQIGYAVENISVSLYSSMEPSGGVALMYCGALSQTEIIKDFSLDALDCASVFVKSGIYCIGYDRKNQSGYLHCVLFVPNPEPDNLHPVIHLGKAGEPKNYYILRPHKKYDTEKETELNRFTRASLFVSAKNPNPTEKGRRCYISFDDGVCMDLTDFADALEADPNISAEDWDGKSFRYSPMEPIDTDAPDYDYWDFKPRRIKRAYAPQWVRAYYDHEDQS